MSYAELQVTSHFSFLRGVSSAEELFSTAALLGIKALAVVDRNSLAGIVRAYEASQVTGVRLIVGCRLDLEDFPLVLVYPTDRAAYGRLCRLLTVGKARAGKGKCSLFIDDVAAWSEGLIAVLVTDKPSDELPDQLQRMKAIFGDRAYCALTRRFLPDEAAHLHDIATMARAGARADRRDERRALSPARPCGCCRMSSPASGCNDHRSTKRASSKRGMPTGFSKTPDEMRAAVSDAIPKLLRRTLEIAERCRFSLDELTYTYPTEVLEDGLNAQERLEKLTWEGAAQRYPEGCPTTSRRSCGMN